MRLRASDSIVGASILLVSVCFSQASELLQMKEPVTSTRGLMRLLGLKYKFMNAPLLGAKVKSLLRIVLLKGKNFR